MPLPLRSLSFIALVGLPSHTLPALADTAESAEAEEAMATDSEVMEVEEMSELISANETLLSQVQTTRLLLDKASRQALSAGGSRETSEFRQDFSVWLARLASDLNEGVSELKAAEAALDRAELRDEEATARVKIALENRLGRALSDLSAREEAGISQELSRMVRTVRAELLTLETVAAETIDTRPIIIEMSFDEALSSEESLRFLEQLNVFQVESGVVLPELPTVVGSSLYLEGRAPADVSARVLRAQVSHIWTTPETIPVEETETTDETETVAEPLPTPTYLGLTLN